MSTVEQIERAVSELNREQLAAFRRWFLEFDAEAWDHQLEQDVAAGRLDELGEEALADLREGGTRPL
jgi:hypothetical protein